MWRRCSTTQNATAFAEVKVKELEFTVDWKFFQLGLPETGGYSNFVETPELYLPAFLHLETIISLCGNAMSRMRHLQKHM